MIALVKATSCYLSRTRSISNHVDSNIEPLRASMAEMAENTAEATGGLDLTESNISGAILNELFENATVPQLKWWLLCQGFQPPSSKKSKID